MHPRSRLAAVLAAALVLPACLEADVRTELRADGSGTMGMSMKFTEKFVEIVRKLEKIDPKQDLVEQTRSGFLKKPDEAMIAALEKRGCKLAEFEAVADEKQISARVKVEFQTLAALAAMKDLEAGKGDSPLGLFSLTRDDKGIYTLAMRSEDGEADGAEEEKKKEEEGEEEKKDPAAEAKKAGEAMALMGEMMGEAAKLKFTVSMKVPGEVVDFTPAVAATKGEGSVTWEFTFQSMMEMQMGGMGGEEEADNPMENFKVRFRMPEGKSLPESALTPVAPTPTPAPAAPAPDAPPKAPEDPK